MKKFISYAQNNEDLMLWRALKDVKSGFYIDVGAQDPHQHSVTKAFYNEGWTGINVEPVDQYFMQLMEHRPKDVNLKLFVGKSKELIKFYEVEETGLSTGKIEYIEEYKLKGFKVIEREVESDTLESICSNFSKQTIHFLKIDVEGFEKEALEGFKFTKFRPWIIVIEATIPTTAIESHFEWEEILTRHDYVNCYNDGLNRFYIAVEKKELKSSFSYPPNCFDYYQSNEMLELQNLNTALLQENLNLKSNLENIRNSLIWRLSYPLRRIRYFLTKVKSRNW